MKDPDQQCEVVIGTAEPDDPFFRGFLEALEIKSAFVRNLPCTPEYRYRGSRMSLERLIKRFFDPWLGRDHDRNGEVGTLLASIKPVFTRAGALEELKLLDERQYSDDDGSKLFDFTLFHDYWALQMGENTRYCDMDDDQLAAALEAAKTLDKRR